MAVQKQGPAPAGALADTDNVRTSGIIVAARQEVRIARHILWLRIPQINLQPQVLEQLCIILLGTLLLAQGARMVKKLA